MSGRKATTNIIPGRVALSVGNSNFQIPDNWVWVELLKVATLATGHTPSRKKPEYWGGEIPWVAVGDARKDDGEVIFKTKQTTNKLGIENSAAVLLPKDTVCLSRTASIGYCIRLGKEMATSQGFVNWVCSKYLNPKFLQMIFIAENQFLKEISEGTAHTTIYFPEVKAFHISLPTKKHQDRVVAKVDALKTQLDLINKSLDHIPTLLKNFRQQVLTQAVTGKLTEEWREGKEMEEWLVRTLNECSSEVFDGPFGSNLKTADYIEEGFQVIRLENIKSHYFDNSKRVFVSKEKYQSLSKNHLKEGDLLLASFVSEGIRATILPKTATPSINKADVFCIRPNQKMLLEKFGLFFLLSKVGEGQINDLAHGMTRPRINTTNLKSLKISLPSIKEQQEIVNRVESLFAKVDAIETHYNALKTKIEHLPQAILHKAFKGELVPQLESDGDARELLDEIEGIKEKDGMVTKKSKWNKEMKANYTVGNTEFGTVAESDDNYKMISKSNKDVNNSQ